MYLYLLIFLAIYINEIYFYLDTYFVHDRNGSAGKSDPYLRVTLGKISILMSFEMMFLRCLYVIFTFKTSLEMMFLLFVCNPHLYNVIIQ